MMTTQYDVEVIEIGEFGKCELTIVSRSCPDLCEIHTWLGLKLYGGSHGDCLKWIAANS